jgi:hypothetical protein
MAAFRRCSIQQFCAKAAGLRPSQFEQALCQPERLRLAAEFSPGRLFQEQTQIINNAIGKAIPKVPAIVSANAESKFASAWTTRLDIPLLHRAPTGISPSPKDER